MLHCISEWENQSTVLHEFEWHCLGVMARMKGALMLKTWSIRRKMSPQLF